MRTAGASAVDEDGARGKRIAFERVLAELSVRFANVSYDGIAAEIDSALAQLVEFLGYDRCTYSELAPDGTFSVLCSAAVDGIEPLARGPFGATLPWLIGELRAGRVVALTDLPNGLPPAAAAEAERVRRIGLRSHLSIPLHVGGRVAGALSFGELRHARTWPDEAITRLTIVGEIFASAIARARADEETQRLRSRLWHLDRVARTGALTAAIAHELNQPLTAILSNAQAGLAYLDRGDPNVDEIRAILQAVVRDDKRAAETIRAMRALLRRDETGRARIDVAAALREVLQLLAAELRRQGVHIETDLATGCWALADKAQIEQVALNLVLNAAAAMQACPRDSRVMRVSVRRDEAGRVVAAVRDAGPGIGPEHRDAVFEPFWTTRREGLGLGLAICRSIVQAHGGRIAVEPNPDRGVTFRFELASAPSGEPVEDTNRVTGMIASQHSTGPEPIVCVVDDDAAVRESLARLLAAAGWNAESFASATEFLERSSLAEVGCILLDNRMPGMSGLELQAHLAAGGFAPPVVFLSGHGDLATGVDAMKLGAVDFLVKPVERDVLVDVVRNALERHAGARKRELERDASRALVGRLSARECEVTAHVIRGRLNKQIAADLGIAEQTVKQHRGRVMEKLEVRSVAELVRVCEASGLFEAPLQLRNGNPPA